MKTSPNTQPAAPARAEQAQRYQLTVTFGRKDRPVMIHDIESGNHVADVYGHTTLDMEHGGAVSLAHLFAAAPELADIARRWMEWATGPVVPIAVRMALQEDTRAAIARATKGSQ